MDYTVVVNNEDRLEIDIKRNTSFNVILFISVLTIGFVGIIVTMIYELIRAPYKLDEKMVITLIISVLIGLFLCKLFLWNLRGKEKIIIQDNQLVIRKTGTLLSVNRKYELSLVDNFSLAKESPYPWWMKMYGIAGGQIKFSYLGEARYFGQTLSPTQAQEIIELIQTRIHINPI
jgi:hypothetical protein